jgi:uncharacterized surface protein with fasciclin (FAS1) repeats
MQNGLVPVIIVLMTDQTSSTKPAPSSKAGPSGGSMSECKRRGGRRSAAAAVVAVAAALLVLAAACGSSATPGSSGSPTVIPTPTVTPVVVPSVSARTIAEAAKTEGLKGFVAAVAAAGLDAALKQNIPYTVLAPDEQAFSSLGLAQFLQNVASVKTVMDYHVIPVENLKIAKIKNGQKAMTNLGFPVVFRVKDGAVMVNDANVDKVIEGPTWSIFVIDKVLRVPAAATPPASPSP